MTLIRRLMVGLIVVALFSFSAQLFTIKEASALTFTVTNTNSTGPGSFVQAVLDANASAGDDTIAFDIPGPGPHIISMTSVLSITDTLTIDATGTGGSVCATNETPASWNVQLDFNLGVNARLHFETGSDNSLVRGLSLVDNADTPAFIYSDNVGFECNAFQLNPDGTEVSTGSGYVYFNPTASGYVGGPDVSNRNYFFVISGVLIDGDGGVNVENNYFGLSLDGSSSSNIVNTSPHVNLRNGGTNVIVEDNVFGGGYQAIGGFNLTGDVNLTARGNKIGTTSSGLTGLGLTSTGIYLHGSLGNIAIGGPTVDDRNVIASNSGHGISVIGESGTRDFTIENNYIGVLADGTGDGNGSNGIEVTSSNLTVVDNVISDNGGTGIVGYGPNATVQGNKIGTDPTGATGLANSQGGVHLYHGASNTNWTVGGSIDTGNLIVNNGDGPGVRIYPSNGYESTVDISYNTLTGNNGNITLDNGNAQNISGSITNNVIDESRAHGILAYSIGELMIQENTISNSDLAAISLIGGDHTIQDNTISDSTTYGISYAADSTASVIDGNDISNSVLDGIYLTGGIDGDVLNNTVTNSTLVGMRIHGANVKVAGNTVTESGEDGIILASSSQFDVHDNIVTDNVNNGIETENGSTGPIYNNIIHSNGNFNLDIGNDGVNSNDNGDLNDPLNHPLIRGLNVNGGNTTVIFTLDGRAGDYRFDICNNPSGNPSGGACEVFLATQTFNDVSSGNNQFEIVVSGTGFDPELLSIQSVRREGGVNVQSSEYGGYQQYGVDLQVNYIQAGSTFGNITHVGPGDEFGVPGGVKPYSMMVQFCHVNGETVTSFSVSTSTVRFLISDLVLFEDYSSVTNLGSIDDEGLWQGEMQSGDCIVMLVIGEVTGAAGTDISLTFDVEMQTLAGGISGEELDPSNNTGTITLPITDQPDIVMESRLLTEGEIVPGTEVEYELQITNLGPGSSNAGFLMLAFLLPDGAVFNGVGDPVPGDGVGLMDGTMFGLDPSGCTEPVIASSVAPGLAAYDGQLVRCVISVPTPAEPGFSARLNLEMTAGSGFVSGSTRAIAVVIAFDESESISFINLFSAGQDGFVLGLNNIAWLTYDADPLTVTINRCSGISAVVLINDACFTITFNKEIYAPSFTVDDLVLEGGGTIYSFVQNSSTQWTVRLTGMTPGGQVRLLLGPASVIDYSAITNGSQVLGENVVRFGTTDSSSGEGSSEGSLEGTSNQLPATGFGTDIITPILMLALGLMLTRRFRPRTNQVTNSP